MLLTAKGRRQASARRGKRRVRFAYVRRNHPLAASTLVRRICQNRARSETGGERAIPRSPSGGLVGAFAVQLGLGVSKDTGMVECEVNVAHVDPFGAPRV